MATAIYSVGRLFVDAFRDNVPVVGDGYHLVRICQSGAIIGRIVPDWPTGEAFARIVASCLPMKQ